MNDMMIAMMLTDILGQPAGELLQATRKARKMLIGFGATEEQANAVIQHELDVAYDALNTLFDVVDEHPDWTEEQCKMEAIRRSKK